MKRAQKIVDVMLDDPAAALGGYMDKLNPPCCLNCHADLTQPGAVTQEWIQQNGSDAIHPKGHYTHRWEFIPDEPLPDLSDYMHLEEFETCSACNNPCWEGLD